MGENIKGSIELYFDDDGRNILVNGEYIPIFTIESDMMDEMFKCQTESKSSYFNITNVEVFNDKVVAITFEDGEIVKSICDERDTFNLERGIEICLLKRLYGGTANYNKQIKNVVNFYNELQEIKKQQEERLEFLKQQKAKKQEKWEKYLKRKENKQINIISKAFEKALEKSYNN